MIHVTKSSYSRQSIYENISNLTTIRYKLEELEIFQRNRYQRKELFATRDVRENPVLKNYPIDASQIRI